MHRSISKTAVIAHSTVTPGAPRVHARSQDGDCNQVLQQAGGPGSGLALCGWGEAGLGRLHLIFCKREKICKISASLPEPISYSYTKKKPVLESWCRKLGLHGYMDTGEPFRGR